MTHCVRGSPSERVAPRASAARRDPERAAGVGGGGGRRAAQSSRIEVARPDKNGDAEVGKATTRAGDMAVLGGDGTARGKLKIRS